MRDFVFIWNLSVNPILRFISCLSIRFSFLSDYPFDDNYFMVLLTLPLTVFSCAQKACHLITTRVEIPEVISAEQRCFRVLTFFSADSENMINISAVQLCFRADQLWFSLNQRCSELKNSALFQSWTALFQRETALNQRCSALIFLLWNIGFSALNSADSALIYSESALIFTHVGETIKIW